MRPSVSVVWPLVLYFVLVVALVAAMLVGSWLLGERHHERATGLPYEGGTPSTGSSHLRLSARFYLVAMFFVVFDLEAVFLFAWAIAARQLGWAGYWEALIFTLVLLAGLAYLWRSGGLDWSPGPSRPLRKYRESYPPAGQ